MKSLALPATNGVRVGNGVAAGARVGDGVTVEVEGTEETEETGEARGGEGKKVGVSRVRIGVWGRCHNC